MGRVKEIYIDLINQYGHVDDIKLDDYIAKRRENEEEREETGDK